MRDLRSLRLRRGLSQADLSAKSGVSEFTISEIEAGKRPNARPSTARKLAAGLGVDVATLYGEEIPSPKVQAPPPSREWALAAPVEEFDSWVKSAASMDLHKLYLSLSDYSKGIEDGKRRLYVVDRAQRAIDQFFRLNPIDREATVDKWPSKATENEGREAG